MTDNGNGNEYMKKKFLWIYCLTYANGANLYNPWSKSITMEIIQIYIIYLRSGWGFYWLGPQHLHLLFLSTWDKRLNFWLFNFHGKAESSGSKKTEWCIQKLFILLPIWNLHCGVESCFYGKCRTIFWTWIRN